MKESTSDLHPTVSCAVDSGHEYLRHCSKSTPDLDYIELSEIRNVSNQKLSDQVLFHNEKALRYLQFET